MDISRFFSVKTFSFDFFRVFKGFFEGFAKDF